MEVRPGYKQTEIGIIPDEWEVMPLKRISPAQSVGLVINPSTYFDEAGTVPMLLGSNIEEGHIRWELARRISEKSNRSLSASRLAAGDLVMVRVGYPGVTAVVPTEIDGCNCASMMIVRQHSSFDSRWLCSIMNSRHGRSQVEHVQYGTAQKQFNISDAINFSYPVPPLTEQRSIAEALSGADILIETMEQLLAKKRDLKKGAMQGLLTGKQRLSGLTGTWDTKRLGQLLTIRHGRSQHDVASENGRFPILATGGVIGKADDCLYDGPSVLIGRKGTIDKPRFMDTPFWTVDTLFYSEVHEPNNAKFLYYRFCLIDWMQYNEASGVPSLNAKTIESIEVQIPSGEEQQSIALLLSDMDAEIAALEEKLEKTLLLKQGMMQELLTGRIRLR